VLSPTFAKKKRISPSTTEKDRNPAIRREGGGALMEVAIANNTVPSRERKSLHLDMEKK